MTDIDEPDAPRADGMREGLKMLRPQWRMLIGGLLAVVLFTGGSVAKPLVIQFAIDHGVSTGNTRNLIIAAIVFVGLILVVYVFQAMAAYAVYAAGQEFLRDLRIRLFEHYQRMSLSFFGRENNGRLVSRMTADIATVSDVLNTGFLTMAQSLLTLISATVILFILSWELALVTAAIIPPLVIATVIFRVASRKAYSTVRERIADVLTHMQESFSGLRVVQAFAREQHNMERFGMINERNFDANVKTVRISSMYFPFVEWLGGLGIGVILFYGGNRVAGGGISVGTVAAFVFYLDFIFQPIQNLSQVYDMAQSAGAALNKIFGLLAIKSDLEEPERPDRIDGILNGRIALEDVTFGYDPERPVLSNINTVIEAGQHVVLVGPTGAGKSTLAKLMTRFYDPTAGKVTLDGHDLRQLRTEDLRRSVAMVPQEGFLFSGTIRENILFGRTDATPAEVEDACRAVGIHEFVMGLADGYETYVSFRGSQFSAGQRQLISIARAFLANPPILVLDEATSSLDPSTEELVEDALRELLRGRTSIVIAHRLSTAEHADRVLVVDKGSIVEDGHHFELLRRGGYYSALYKQWTSGRHHGDDDLELVAGG